MQVLTAALIAVLVVVPCAVFWARMFADMNSNESLAPDARTTWMFVFVLLNVFGAALYYFNEYRRR